MGKNHGKFSQILFLDKNKSNSIKSGISVLLISFLSPKKRFKNTKKISTDFKIKIKFKKQKKDPRKK